MRTGTRRVSVALTWDGARWPRRGLPAGAQEFLKEKAPAPKALARLLRKDEVEEIRICWVPRLKGGAPALGEPFLTRGGLRLGFRLVRQKRFGDVLGAVYRRIARA